jgi:hypothetical protein
VTFNNVERLRLPNLDVLAALELQQLLPNDSYTLEEEQVHWSRHGDLGVTAAIVVVLTPATLFALTAWLLKRRKRISVDQTIEKIAPDGAIEKHSLKIIMSESETPQVDALKAIAKLLKLDPKIIAAITDHEQMKLPPR